MEQTPELQRAIVLHEQGRHELAEKELRQHLVQQPNHGIGHALLAISLLEQEKLDEAENSAGEAISHSPDLAFCHYALARVLSARNDEDTALAVIQEAIRLEPADADYHAMMAGIEFDRRNWPRALTAAETGLQFSPEHISCNNLRSMALVKLGRKAEASATIDQTLSRNPENAFSHANKGWTLLEQGRRAEAMHHFRESLSIDPNNGWARAGLVEGLKAGNPIYAIMLRYFLWMQKLSNGARWGIIVGGYLLNRLMAGAAHANPALAPWLLPIRLLYGIFVVLTWLANPVFNLMLFLHPIGRHALDEDDRAQAKWVGLLLLVAVSSLAAMFISRHGYFLLPAMVFGLLAIPAASVFGCQPGWPRMTMLAVTLGLAVAGFLAVALSHNPKGSDARALGNGSFYIFLLGIFISSWAANWLVQQRPSR